MTVKSTVRSAVRAAIRGTVRSGGALLPEWTPIYDGLTTFGELYSAWKPSGNDWEIEVEFYNKNSPEAQTKGILSFGTVSDSSFIGKLGASSLGDIVYHDGVTTNNKVLDPQDGSLHTVSVDSSDGGVFSDSNTVIGGIADPIGRFCPAGTQIHRIKLLDNYDTGRTEYPVNGRDVVPLDGLTQYGEIPAWQAVNWEVKFDFHVTTSSSTEYAFGSYDGAFRFYCRRGNANVMQYGIYDNIYNGVIEVVHGKTYSVTMRVVNGFFSSEVNGAEDVPSTVRNGEIPYLPLFIGGLNQEGALKSPLYGFVANLRLTDLDNPSNSRYYPLDRVDIIQDVNGDGSTDGNWVNNPAQVHRPNNSIDINTVKRSKEAPSVSDNLLVNSLNGQEAGSITNLTGYELVNRGE